MRRRAGRERADLGTERGDRLLALGLDLRLAVLDDAAGLGLGLLAHLRDDRGTLLARLLADASGLVPGLGELLLELGELGVGLGLLGLGSGQAALDRLRALGERLLEVRNDELLDAKKRIAKTTSARMISTRPAPAGCAPRGRPLRRRR
jgi:hypothetical protein